MDHPKDPVSHVHLVSWMLKEEVSYPEHPPRKESEAYRKVRHHLVVEEDSPVHSLRSAELDDR